MNKGNRSLIKVQNDYHSPSIREQCFSANIIFSMSIISLFLLLLNKQYIWYEPKFVNRY